MKHTMNNHPSRLTRMLRLVRVISLAILSCWMVIACSIGDVPKATIPDNTTDPHWVSKQHEPHSKIALVFVHGIFGDTVGTWTYDKNTSFFSLISKDPKIGPKVDMYAFGYTSNMLKQGSFGIDEAANTMYARLKSEGVFDYPAIVFINHSMGGLVTMQMLYQHPAILPRVPDVVFFSTPQSGADITRIAQLASNNEALGNMLPGDKNAFIRVLNDNWKAIDPKVRPRVHCGYEKEDTYGVKIVEWASGTRFCDSALAIAANHLTIVKPDRPAHDSFLVVRETLEPLLTRKFDPILETPDFATEGGRSVITIDNPFGKKDVRIKNAGGGELKYSLDQWPDGLYIWPKAGDHVVEGEGTDNLQVAVAYAATRNEYQFVLTSNVMAAQTVLVRVPNLAAVHAEQFKMAGDVLEALSVTLNNAEQAQKLRRLSQAEAQQSIVDIVRTAVVKRDPTVPEVGQWVLTAELLNAVNWPELGAAALRRAEATEPSVSAIPAVKMLVARIATLSGEPSLSGIPALPQESVRTQWASAKTPFTSSELTIQQAASVSAAMRLIPSLNVPGLSLEGDVARAKGDSDQAVKVFQEMSTIESTPSSRLRLGRALGERNAH